MYDLFHLLCSYVSNKILAPILISYRIFGSKTEITGYNLCYFKPRNIDIMTFVNNQGYVTTNVACDEELQVVSIPIAGIFLILLYFVCLLLF